MNEALQPQPTPEKEQPRRVFVEIGSGVFPSYYTPPNEQSRKSFANTDYIGIDIDAAAVDQAKKITGRISTEHLSSIGLNQARFDQLPLPDHSVDEVYAANVFAGCLAAQDIAAIRQQLNLLRQGADVISKLPPQQRPFANLVAELILLRHKLKPDGQLTVVETNTPTDPKIMHDVLDKLGFDIVRWITPGDKLAWAEQHANYHIPKFSELELDAYIVHAKPRQEHKT